MNNVGAYNFDFHWHFHNGEVDNQNFGTLNGGVFKSPQWQKVANQAVAMTGYPDEEWETVNVPHDYAIEACNFTKDKPSLIGSLGGEIAWYRKEFVIPKEEKGKRIFLRCDGVYRDSQVWCNGNFIGRNLGGYMGFTYELTEVIDYEEVNTIAIRTDATAPEGWWYTGAGILRDVWLIALPELCIKDHGTYFETKAIDLEQKIANINVRVQIDNGNFQSQKANIKVELYDGTEKIKQVEKVEEVDGLSIKEVKIPVDIENLIPWDVSNCHLYTGKVYLNDQLCYEDTFGPREITYNAKEGMFLNGKSIFMRGACGHDDFAGVGGALPKAIIRFKVEKLMEMGCNAYRCSHNPPPPAFLDICDELGMLVVDETRLPGTSYEMERDFIELICRDRNHPSVVFWSMGNEEMKIQGNRMGVNIFKKMRALGKKYDDTREYLFAINCDYDNLLNYHCSEGMELPVNGVNYQLQRNHDALKIIHKDHPEMCFINTETTGFCSVRGYRLFNQPNYDVRKEIQELQIWPNPKFDHNFNCYGDFYPRWGLKPDEILKDYQGQKHMLGFFLWTGFDYRGETFPFEYPQTVSSYGLIDLCGYFKDWAYYFMTQWKDEPKIHILPSWNLPEPEGEIIQVWAFSNCNDAELFLNGKSMGRKTKESLDKFVWECPYEKGTLLVQAYENNEVICKDMVVTSKEPVKLVLSTEKEVLAADGQDISIVNVIAIDEDGHEVKDADLEVRFKIHGEGRLKGVGNGKPDSIEHDKKPVRKLYAGKAMALIESTTQAGEIHIEVQGDGIEGAELSLVTRETLIEPRINANWSKVILDGKTDDWA